MAIEKVVNLKIVDNTERTENGIKSLREQIRQATANVALMADKFGATSREAVEAARRAAELKDQMGDARALTDAFNPDAKFKALTGALAGVSAGFTAYQGLLGVAGVENAELEKQILKVQSAMAVTQGLQTIGESVDTFKQLGAVIKSTAVGQAVLTAAQSAYTFVVGASTTALKAFRIALVSTGVGALVVGLGLLIANFEKISNWVGNLIEKFGGWRQALMFVAPPIWAIVKALEAMGVIETEAEEKSRKADEAKAARKAEQAKKLLADQKRLGDYYDFEIAKAEAAGKSTFELEQKKRDAILKTAFAYNEATRALIQSGKATEEQVKAWNENQALIIKTQQEGVVAQIKNEKEKNDKLLEAQKEANQKAKEARDKARAERLEQLKKDKEELDAALKQQLEATRAQEAEVTAAIEEAIQQRANQNLTAQEVEEQSVNDKYFRLIELARQQNRDTADLEIAQANELNNIRLNYQQQALDLETQRLEEERQRDEIVAQNKEQQLQTNLNNIYNILALGGERFAKIQKALAIAEIVRDTIRAVNAATGNEIKVPAFIGVIPNPVKPASLVSTALGIAGAVAKGAASIAAITSGSSSLTGGGGAGVGVPGGGAAPAAPQFNIVGQNPNNQLAATIAGQQGQPIRTYVVGQEVTTQQSLDRQIRTTATFNS